MVSRAPQVEEYFPHNNPTRLEKGLKIREVKTVGQLSVAGFRLISGFCAFKTGKYRAALPEVQLFKVQWFKVRINSYCPFGLAGLTGENELEDVNMLHL